MRWVRGECEINCSESPVLLRIQRAIQWYRTALFAAWSTYEAFYNTFSYSRLGICWCMSSATGYHLNRNDGYTVLFMRPRVRT